MNQRYIREIRINWEKIEQGNYVREIPALSELTSLTLHKNITFFVGENGTGKSTLLEAVAGAYGLNPEGGSRNYRFESYQVMEMYINHRKQLLGHLFEL